jgi:CIC family chloride channel protein
VITLASAASGVLMAVVRPDAAGSGIPQLKAAYWKDLGAVSFRAVLIKFIGGALALGGGASLGREGPTVYMGGGFASKVAGWLGVPYRRRRHAVASGAAAGLAAAFNTPLASISFVLEEILGDLTAACSAASCWPRSAAPSSSTRSWASSPPSRCPPSTPPRGTFTSSSR